PLDGRIVAATYIPHRNEQGETASVIIMIQDVTERKVMERELVESRERAEAANQAKTMFLANMSHELRTPLGGIIGMLEAAMRLAPPEDLARRLQSAMGAAEHLARLVDDVLDFSRVEAGRMTLEPADFDTARLLDAMDDMLRLQFERKGLSLDWEVDPELPRLLHGDSRRIKQVVVNLLSNALKHTETGGVRVGLEQGPQTDGGFLLRFKVEDTGPGVPPDKHEAIFESFTQLEQTGERTIGGAGLGLALCRHLARLMGGDVAVVSQPGRGSVFVFEAVLRPAKGMPEAEAAEAEPVSTETFRVLVAEDNPLNAELVMHHLASAGHQPTLAVDGRQVLSALKTARFDIILMDMEMPEVNGIEAARRIRAGESGLNPRDIPIVAVTAHVLPEYRRMCEEAGMDGYLPKPVRLEELLRTLHRYAETGD
ncbi:MAG: ATP-binding protein, partial [Desulfovibrionaceae bacterium]